MAASHFPDRFRTFLILGAPGSGKGTQGVVLGRVPRFHHLACGDVFRSLDTRTTLGQKFVEYSSRGELVPDDLTVQLWKANVKDRVEAHQFKPEIDFLVLDGIPRNVEQAEYMEQHINVLQVFHLSCPDRTELTRRLRKRALKDNRFDDASDVVIQKRFERTKPKPNLSWNTTPRTASLKSTPASHPPVSFPGSSKKSSRFPNGRKSRP